MAYPTPRSMNADFYKGSHEGGIRSDTPDRGGVVSAPTAQEFRASDHTRLGGAGA